jgi:hypothetical protein
MSIRINGHRLEGIIVPPDPGDPRNIHRTNRVDIRKSINVFIASDLVRGIFKAGGFYRGTQTESRSISRAGTGHPENREEPLTFRDGSIIIP